jgi:hypothetical protein
VVGYRSPHGVGGANTLGGLHAVGGAERVRAGRADVFRSALAQAEVALNDRLSVICDVSLFFHRGGRDLSHFVFLTRRYARYSFRASCLLFVGFILLTQIYRYSEYLTIHSHSFHDSFFKIPQLYNEPQMDTNEQMLLLAFHPQNFSSFPLLPSAPARKLAFLPTRQARRHSDTP